MTICLVACATICSSAAYGEDVSVHGRVMGQTIDGDHLGPVPGAKIELATFGGDVLATVTADDDGYYVVDGLGASQYAYKIEAAGFLTENARRRIEVSAAGVHVVDFVLTQGSDESPQPDEPAEPEGGELQVRAFAEQNGKRALVPNAEIRLRRDTGGPILARTSGPQGRRAVRVPPGTWRVSAAAPGGESKAHPEPITIAPGARQTVDIDVPAPPPAPRRAPLPKPPANDGRKVAFYGDVAPAERVVFVVDKSNSMQFGRFDLAFAELERAVSYLTETQQFYVVFFSDTVHPMFDPLSPDGLVPATPQRRAQLEQFATDLPYRLGTNARPALERALALKPDVIYLLGDGAFTDDTVSYLASLTDNTIPICTVSFQSLQRGAAVMKRIADRTGGRFIYVP
ncbi:MAG: carboxypeptidase regulatory-like domain-containing protein [Planctomycetales bacterium]|nr:carboxypeptidase regulatory-like domain-containing protein [Planctomycetales bacterium]MBN8624717.1 carboxypeptidase regulatory-like domain-containing protein [Planctomycetota bacterium]